MTELYHISAGINKDLKSLLDKAKEEGYFKSYFKIVKDKLVFIAKGFEEDKLPLSVLVTKENKAKLDSYLQENNKTAEELINQMIEVL